MKRHFYCYSRRLQRALTANGFKYILKGCNRRTGSIFWLYEGTKELNDYKNNKYPKERDDYKHGN